MPTQAINIQYVETSSVTFTAPIQQMTFLDSTNRQYLRQLFVSQDGIKLVRGSNVVLIPAAQLWAAGSSYNPYLTWPPKIVTQPTSASANAPNSVDFSVSASSEIATTYEWQMQGAASSSFETLPIVSQSIWTGSATENLHISASDLGLDQSQFRCVLTNASGQTTSSAVILYVY